MTMLLSPLLLLSFFYSHGGAWYSSILFVLFNIHDRYYAMLLLQPVQYNQN